jgi:hypothetical protein
MMTHAKHFLDNLGKAGHLRNRVFEQGETHSVEPWIALHEVGIVQVLTFSRARFPEGFVG